MADSTGPNMDVLSGAIQAGLADMSRLSPMQQKEQEDARRDALVSTKSEIDAAYDRTRESMERKRINEAAAAEAENAKTAASVRYGSSNIFKDPDYEAAITVNTAAAVANPSSQSPIDVDRVKELGGLVVNHFTSKGDFARMEKEARALGFDSLEAFGKSIDLPRGDKEAHHKADLYRGALDMVKHARQVEAATSEDFLRSNNLMESALKRTENAVSFDQHDLTKMKELAARTQNPVYQKEYEDSQKQWDDELKKVAASAKKEHLAKLVKQEKAAHGGLAYGDEENSAARNAVKGVAKGGSSCCVHGFLSGAAGGITAGVSSLCRSVETHGRYQPGP